MDKKMMELMGIEVKEGYIFHKMGQTLSYIEKEDGDGIESLSVIPLNGWRARNLAEYLLGERTDKWRLGDAMVVPAIVIQTLPGWDREHQEYVNSFEEYVAFEVVVIDPTYAKYIALTQL